MLYYALPAFAHELWIEAVDYKVAPQGRLVANIVNGENFGGHALPYIPRAGVVFELAVEGRPAPVEARGGDKPALNVSGAAEGLNVVIYRAAIAPLTYHSWEKFGNFIAHKDLPTSLADHLARGFPETDFKEIYSRYSKALIAVGAGAGSDRSFGLVTELVALANPYTDALPDGLPVQLLYNAAPRADAQIEIFEKNAQGNIEVTTTRTNEAGIAMIEVRPGHIYMLDAVVLRQPSAELAEKHGAVWESLWANLTFAVPAGE